MPASDTRFEEDDLRLTRGGRLLLAEKARHLREETIPAMVEALHDGERDGRVDAEYERAVDELERLTHLLDIARAVEELPRNPRRVELGDIVTIELAVGTTERYLIVHPAEAALDEFRVSSESPLSRALLGRFLGDEVKVVAPGGAYRCRIVSIQFRNDRVTHGHESARLRSVPA